MQEINETQEQNCVGLTVQREARCTDDLLGFSDEKLLKLAYKALNRTKALKTIKGIRVDANDDFIGLIVGTKFRNDRVLWNPLTDNADAFELGVKLGLEMRGQSSVNQVYIEVYGESKIVQRIDGDACNAMRKAIVLAAAQIGRART